MKRSGIDVVRVSDLKIRDLAPNGLPGRFAAYTEKAIKQIGEKFR
jgi:ribosomal protein L4